MNLETLKQQIAATVDALQDEALLQHVIDMLSQHSFNRNEINSNDTDLTLLCMTISGKSLSEAWNQDDDDRWDSFLKN